MRTFKVKFVIFVTVYRSPISTCMFISDISHIILSCFILIFNNYLDDMKEKSKINIQPSDENTPFPDELWQVFAAEQHEQDVHIRGHICVQPRVMKILFPEL